MTKEELKAYLDSDDFATRIVKLTRHTVRDVFKNMMLTTVPLLMVLMSLIIWIFNTQHNSIDKLSTNVLSLSGTVSALEQSIYFLNRHSNPINKKK